MRALVLIVFSTLCLATAGDAHAQQGDGSRLLADYLDALNAEGWQIVYSSDLVDESMRVPAEAGTTGDADTLDEVLAAHGLKCVEGAGGILLVVEREQTADSRPALPVATVEPIPEIVVTAGVHRLGYDGVATHTHLGRELATRIPTVAEEAVRLTDRVPGTANGGVSTRTHVRGGEANEVLYRVDGLRLYEPFHLKDFQSIATTINSAAVADMEFFTGAYPARYGDRMSGVVDIDIRSPTDDAETELALSFFNTSLLSMGRFGSSGAGDWLVSARRGNLDLIADAFEPEYGSPDYSDYLLRGRWDLGPRARITANLMVAKDKLSLADADRGERANADYRNVVYWLRWDADWNEGLTSETLLASTDIDNRRSGSVDLPGIVSGSLNAEVSFRVTELRQDWRAVLSPDLMLRFGLNLRDLEATHRFASLRQIEEPFASLPGAVPSGTTNILATPSGAQYAAYGELRWRPTTSIVVDVGLRWDQQTYTTASDDSQVSPRAGMLIRPRPGTAIRLGWGRYYQAQEINELQVSDGVASFFPAQRAEHFLLSVEQALPLGVDLEFTAWHKRFGSLRPRFENLFNSLTLLPELQFDRTRIDPTASEAQGIDIVASQGAAEDDLLWWIGWSWAEATDTTASGPTKRSWDQTHTVKAGVSWRSGRWNFSAAGEVHTGWPRTELIGTMVDTGGVEQLELSMTPRNSGRYSVFHSLDVRISREFELSHGELTTFLEITNVYDRANPCCTEYAIAASGELAAKAANWLPLVPSLGVVWRF